MNIKKAVCTLSIVATLFTAQAAQASRLAGTDFYAINNTDSKIDAVFVVPGNVSVSTAEQLEPYAVREDDNSLTTIDSGSSLKITMPSNSHTCEFMVAALYSDGTHSYKTFDLCRTGSVTFEQ